MFDTAGNVHVHAFVLINREIKFQYENICEFQLFFSFFYLNGDVLIGDDILTHLICSITTQPFRHMVILDNVV